jgi:chitodextrinase
VTITGAGADAEGPVSLAWSLVSGPSVVSFSAPTAATTMVEGLNVAGTYTIKLTVTDTAGLKATDNMVITVNAAPANILPTANAGADTSITLPNSTLELEGIATDSDGEIREYQWTQVGGANTAGITEHDAGQVTISFLIPGTYTFQFRVVDDKGGMATDTINVVVNKALNKGQSKKVNVLQIKRF